MTIVLPDGTVVPSYFATETPGFAQDDGAFTNLGLRVGEIKELIYPEDKRSRTKKFIEYRAIVQHRDANGPGVTVEYPNCMLANPLGGIADKFRFTLRADKSGDKLEGDGLGAGSKVLLLCINGETNQAVILGGIRDEKDAEKDKKDDGHNLLFEFNGIRAEVNKDGELKVSFKGATNADGALMDGADSNASGTAFTLKKDGSYLLEHGPQKFLIDHPGKKVDLEAEQTLNLKGPSGVNVNSDGNVKITSAGTKIGGDAAVDALVKGTTYRTAETTLHTTMSTGLSTLLSLLTSMSVTMGVAGASLQAASALHKIPIAGPIVGSVPLQVGATAFTSMVAMLTGMATALTSVVTALSTFESSASSYLSTKNTTD